MSNPDAQTRTTTEVLILYFSGAGNTRYAAHYLARKLRELSVEATVLSIEEAPPERLPGFTLLGVGFPVHGGDAPIPVSAYLGALPPGEGRGVFAFCTKGLIAAGATRRVLRRLARRGYVPVAEAGVNMPGIDLLAFLSKDSRLLRWMTDRDFSRLEPLDRLAHRIAEVLSALGQGKAVTDFRMRTPSWPGAGLFEALWSRGYQWTLNLVRDKFYADERCNLCGLCVRECPAGNIRIVEGRIQFGGRCYICLRCLHHCPQEAIQLGEGTVGKARWRGPDARR